MKIKSKNSLFVCSLVGSLFFATASAAAESDNGKTDQLEQRIKVLEQQLKTLDTELKKTILESSAAESSAAESSAPEVVLGESFSDNLRTKMSTHGFASAAIAVSDTEGTYAGGTINEDPNTQNDSVVGIQTDFLLSPKAEFVVQIIGRGNDKFDADISWAFLHYKLQPRLSLRAGRLRVPFFINSEYLEVGYTYPWVRPPQEVYSTSFNDYEGFDVNYEIIRDPWRLLLQGYYGRGYLSRSTSVGALDKSKGVSLRLTNGPWLARMSYYSANISTDFSGGAAAINQALASLNQEQFVLDHDPTSFTTFGFAYDDGKWWVMAEASIAQLTGIFDATHAHYLSVGYQFGPWLPYYTYAKRYTADDEGFNQTAAALTQSGIPEYQPYAASVAGAVSQQESGTLGVRYNLSPNIALKVAYQHFYDFNESKGQFSKDPGDNVDMLTFVVDVVF